MAGAPGALNARAPAAAGSHHGHDDVDVAAGGVGVGAHPVRRVGGALGLLGVGIGEVDSEGGGEHEAAIAAGTYPDSRGHGAVADIDLEPAGDHLEGAV